MSGNMIPKKLSKIFYLRSFFKNVQAGVYISVSLPTEVEKPHF